MHVGFIGLGLMGRPMVERLMAAGHRVHVHNRSRAAVDALAERGAIAEGSAADVAERADVVLTALPVPAASEQVYGDLAQHARPGQVYVEHSTLSPDLSRRCAEWLAARGAAYLDAPVSGGPGGARAGTLTVMVGGDEATFERVLPLLRAFGQNIRRCGPVGAGQVVKLVNQLLVCLHTASIAEAAVLGAKLGADPAVLLDLIGTSFGGSAMLLRNLPRFVQRDFGPASPIRLFVKDLGVLHAEAKAAGAPLYLGALVEQRYLEAVARGLAEMDMAAIVQLWEQAAGVQVGADTPQQA